MLPQIFNYANLRTVDLPVANSIYDPFNSTLDSTRRQGSRPSSDAKPFDFERVFWVLQMLAHIFVGEDLVQTLDFDLMKSGTNMIQESQDGTLQTPQIIDMDRHSHDIEIMHPTWNTSITDDVSSTPP